MGIRRIELEEKMEKIAPLELAEEWDNCGFQIVVQGSPADKGDLTFEKVLVTLDITPEVIEEAVEKGADLIVSHHPLLFTPLVTIDDPKVIALIRHGISVYSAHTNFDAAIGGNNDYLVDLLKLKNIESVEGIRIGELESPKALKELVSDVDKAINSSSCTSGRTYGDDTVVSRALICTGAGGGFIATANGKGCDVIVTGELKYHEALEAREFGIATIEAGHFETEHIFIANLAEKLRKTCGDSIEIIQSSTNTNPY